MRLEHEACSSIYIVAIQERPFAKLTHRTHQSAGSEICITHLKRAKSALLHAEQESAIAYLPDSRCHIASIRKFKKSAASPHRCYLLYPSGLPHFTLRIVTRQQPNTNTINVVQTRHRMYTVARLQNLLIQACFTNTAHTPHMRRPVRGRLRWIAIQKGTQQDKSAGNAQTGLAV